MEIRNNTKGKLTTVLDYLIRALPEGRNHSGDLGVDGRIILGWISRRWDVGILTGLGWPKIETGGGRL